MSEQRSNSAIVTARQVLAQFLTRLQAAAADPATPTPDDASAATPMQISLQLGAAAVRYADPDLLAELPPQLAVLGPTQTGKSTVVNLLVERTAAEVSPLAGFTVHAQAFAPYGVDLGWADRIFPDFERQTVGGLRRADIAAFTVQELPPRPGTTLFGEDPDKVLTCVVWDTPDFDSLAAHQYQAAVLEAAALADVHLLVLSKEKYSDLAVWRMIALLRPLQRPLVLCTNKTTPEDEATIRRVVGERLTAFGFEAEQVPVLMLPYAAGGAPAATLQTPAERLRTALRTQPHAPDTATRAAQRRQGAAAFVQTHWDAWLAPVRAQHAALAAWQTLVQEAGERFVQTYERDYLDHPERYDSFRRAALELLDLLELPRVGAFVARTRRVVTAPARMILKVGREWFANSGQPRPTAHRLETEIGVLLDAVDAMLIGLEREAGRRALRGSPEAPVWAALAQRLTDDAPRLKEEFRGAIEAHHAAVTAEVRVTARQLYETLRRHPGRLTTLRGARAAIDVGYVLLAVKTGGLTPLDAVWAPATFAVTSLLMEGVAGAELRRAAGHLKEKQRVAVRDTLVGQHIAAELATVATELDGPTWLAIHADDVTAAEAALHEWRSADE